MYFFYHNLKSGLDLHEKLPSSCRTYSDHPSWGLALSLSPSIPVGHSLHSKPLSSALHMYLCLSSFLPHRNHCRNREFLLSIISLSCPANSSHHHAIPDHLPHLNSARCLAPSSFYLLTNLLHKPFMNILISQPTYCKPLSNTDSLFAGDLQR